MKVIAFSGAQNTGKTTIMRQLGNLLTIHGYKVQVGYKLPSDDQSISRRSKRLGFTINESSNFESQYHILLSYLTTDLETRKAAELNRCDFVLYDRGIIDVLPYSKRVTTKKEFSIFKNLYDIHDKMYPLDHLIYCEPVPFDDDGHRSVDPNFQNEIISLFKSIVVPRSTYVLKNEPVNERLSTLRKILMV